ncbi:hypothetical protein Gotur_023946, partial [Gossypium turneri]
MGPIWFRVILITVLVLEAAVWSDGYWDEERVALLQLQPLLSLRGFNWTEEKGSDCCEWEWVECNITTKQVTQLSLNNGLLWYLEFFNASLFLPFEELRSLDLSYNDLVGVGENEAHLKWLSKLGSLETLDLSETKMKNNLLLHLGGLSSLTTLKLEGNHLEGRIHLQGK